MSATPRTVDLSFGASLAWPERYWPEPRSFEDVADQAAIRRARVQGLPDRVEDQSAVDQAASFFRTR